MSGTSHNLWCLVKGDEAPFYVTARSNILISDLKERIRKKYQNRHSGLQTRTLEGALFLVICSDIMGDTILPVGQCGL